MQPDQLKVLQEALEHKRSREEFEQAVGRATRKLGLPFQFYVQLMGEVREFARSQGVPVETAAKRLLEQGDQDS